MQIEQLKDSLDSLSAGSRDFAESLIQQYDRRGYGPVCAGNFGLPWGV